MNITGVQAMTTYKISSQQISLDDLIESYSISLVSSKGKSLRHVLRIDPAGTDSKFRVDYYLGSLAEKDNLHSDSKKSMRTRHIDFRFLHDAIAFYNHLGNRN